MLHHLSPNKFIELIADFRGGDKWNFKCIGLTVVLFRNDLHLYEKGFRDVYDTLNEYFPDVNTYEVLNHENPEIAESYGIKEMPSTMFISAQDKYLIDNGFLSREKVIEDINSLL